MKGETQAERQRFQYLLGLSTPADRERLESEYFGDEDEFQKMLTAEDDLIDAYVRGKLSENERQQFEERFMNSPQKLERVHFARTLGGAVSPSTPVQPHRKDTDSTLPGFFASLSAWSAPVRAGAMMVVVVVVGAFAWLLVERTRMRGELQALRQKATELQGAADTERAKTAATEKQLDELRASIQRDDSRPGADQSPPTRDVVDINPKKEQVIARGTNPRRKPSRNTDNAPPGNVFAGNQSPPKGSVAYDLSPGSVRSGGGTTLSIPADKALVVLRLATDGHSLDDTYVARIETADGRPVVVTPSFKPGKLEFVELPPITASKLRAGHYVLFLQRMMLNGTSARVAEYSFRVSKN